MLVAIAVLNIVADLAHIVENVKTSVEQHDEVYRSIQRTIDERAKKQEELRKQRTTYVA
jgi:hypothetical protein